MPEWSSTPDSSSGGDSDQQSVGLSSGLGTCVLKQDRFGHKALSPVCCVMHIKEPSAVHPIVTRRGFALFFS